MKFFINAFDILGAALSSQMTGDLKSHGKWMLIVAALLFLGSYLIVRP